MRTTVPPASSRTRSRDRAPDGRAHPHRRGVGGAGRRRRDAARRVVDHRVAGRLRPARAPPSTSRRAPRRSVRASVVRLLPRSPACEVGLEARVGDELGRAEAAEAEEEGRWGAAEAAEAGRAGDGVRRARHLQARDVDRLERRARHGTRALQARVVPARIGRAAHEPGRPVVGQNHPVLLQRAQDHLVLRREAADVEARLEPEPRAHGRIGGAAASRPCGSPATRTRWPCAAR